MIEFGKSNKGLDVFIMRPSGVTPKDRSVLKSIAASVAPMIRVNELAASMLDVAVHGAEKQTWENGDLVTKGKEVLGASK